MKKRLKMLKHVLFISVALATAACSGSPSADGVVGSEEGSLVAEGDSLVLEPADFGSIDPSPGVVSEQEAMFCCIDAGGKWTDNKCDLTSDLGGSAKFKKLMTIVRQGSYEGCLKVAIEH